MSNLAEKIDNQSQLQVDTALVIYKQILDITITDQDSYGRMAALVKKAKEGKKAIQEWFKPLKESAQKAHKDVCARESETIAPYAEAETTGQGEMNRWLNEEKRRADAEALRLREEAAERARLEKEELERSAEALEASGSATAAAALRQEAAQVVEAPVFTNTVDRTVRTGGAVASAQTETVVEVTDVKAFLKYLVETGSAAAFIDFPVAKLKAWVKSNGLKPGQVPGLAIQERLKSSIR